METKEHYQQLLAARYAWMHGNFEEKANIYQTLFEQWGIVPSGNGEAIDLGSGHGLQAIPLAKLGYRVTAIDTSNELLNELKSLARNLPIKTMLADINTLQWHTVPEPALMVCAGDTLTHLASLGEVTALLHNCIHKLGAQGKLFLSFRDYSIPLEGQQRVIPVRQDEKRLMSCVLDYKEEHVEVTDIFWERVADEWVQYAGCYQKVRINPQWLISFLEDNKMRVCRHEMHLRMCTILAIKEK